MLSNPRLHARRESLYGGIARGLPVGGRRTRTGRQSLTRAGTRSADRRHLKAAEAAREVWLLACSAELHGWSACRILAAYRRRMHIEESVRDLKSHQYSHAFENSQTRTAQRLEMLLLIHALALLAALLIGHNAATLHLHRRLLPHAAGRRRYSVLRIGWGLAARGWIRLQQIHALSPMPLPPHDVMINTYRS